MGERNIRDQPGDERRVRHSGRLRTVARDPRILRWTVTSFRVSSRAIRFVDSLCARLARRRGLGVSTRRQLRVAPRLRPVGHTLIRINPRFELAVGAGGDRATTSPRQLWRRFARYESSGPHPRMRSEHLVLRVVSRAERVTGVPYRGQRLPALAAPGGPSSAVGFGSAPIVRTVRRVVLEPHAAVGENQPKVTTDDERKAPFVGFGAKPSTGMQSPATADGVEVERLTSQVIAAIDRRIVAERERLGRV
jgi:hypothetical protein